MKKILIIALVSIGVGGGALAIYLNGGNDVVYRTASVDRGAIISTVSATGTLNAVVTVQVGTQVSGTIQRLLVDYNSKVHKGQAIAEIDPSLMNTQVEQTRGNYLSAEAGLEKAKVAVADTERTVKRNRQLAAEGIISQSELDSSITARDSALAGLRAAEAFLIQTRGAYRQAETNLSYTIIRSPVDGVVVSRSVDVGQTVAASFQTPTLFTIAQDLKRMQIETSVDEADIGKIITGQKVSFTVDAYPDKPFSGSVSQIRNAPVTTQNVVTYTVIIAVNNSELKLKPGMTANVSIEVDRKDGILRIPAAALRFHPKDGEERSNRKMAPAGRGQVVYKLTKDMKPQPLKVTTGISDGTFVEAVSGEIQEGDALIVEQTGQKQPPARPRMGGGAMGPRI